MIEIKYIDDTPSQELVYLGNKYENLDESIRFEFEEKYHDDRKYALAFHGVDGKNKTNVILPIKENILKISTDLTCLSGEWVISVMCRKSELDLTEDIVDLSPRDDERIMITDPFIGMVKDNYIDKKSLDNYTMDSNVKIVYDELISLKEFLDNAKITSFYKGDSNYDLAVKNGYLGTEQEWLDTLPYKHSDEFEELSNQVHDDAIISKNNANDSLKYSNDAKVFRDSASGYATKAQELENNAKQSESQAKLAEENASKTSDVAAQTLKDITNKSNDFNITYQNASTTIDNKVQEATDKAEIASNAALQLSDAVEKVNSFDSILETKLTQPYVNTSEKHLSDSDNGRMLNLKITGGYSQESTNGYQLFDASKLPTSTVNGVTVINNGDGSFSITGNGDLSENFYLAHTYSHEDTLKLLKVGKITLNQNGDTLPHALIQLVRSSGDSTWIQLNKTNQTTNITQEMLDDSGCYLQTYLIGISGSAIKTGTIKPMLYQDGDGTWEPFTGGAPSPNPEYPQEPKFVGDIGQNLFDYTKLPTKSQGGATVTNNNDGSFMVSGSGSMTETYISSTGNIIGIIKPLLKPGLLKVGKTSAYPYYYVNINYNKDGVDTFYQLRSTNQQQFELTSDIIDNMTSFYYGFTGGGTTIKTGTIRPMLYQDGDGTYRPYSESSRYYLDFEITGKNLFNKDNIVASDKISLVNDIFVANDGDNADVGYIKCQNYDANRKYINTSGEAQVKLGINKMTAKVSKDSKYFRIANNGKKIEWGFLITHTLPENTIVTVSFDMIDATIGAFKFKNVQIEVGDSATGYEQFRGIETKNIELDEPLRALSDDIKDTIENGNIIRRVGKIIFDGSSDENWKNTESKNGYTRYLISISNINNSSSILCDRLPVINGIPENFTQQCAISYVDHYFRIIVSDNNVTTVEELLTWLQETPITIWYKLKTPIIEPLSVENTYKLSNLRTYYSATNIFTNADINFDYKLNLPSWYNKVSDQVEDARETIYDIQAQVNDVEITALTTAINTEYTTMMLEEGMY